MIILRRQLISGLDALSPEFSEKEINRFSKALQRQFEKYDGDILLSDLPDIMSALKFDTKLIDRWAKAVVQQLNVNELRENTLEVESLLNTAIESKFSSCASYLIDHDLGVVDHRGGYTTLFDLLAHPKYFNQELFDKLLAKETYINYQFRGQTALYLAIEAKNYYAVDKILEREDLKFTGVHGGHDIFDLVKRDPAMYKKIAAKVNEKFSAKQYEWRELIAFPIAELDQHNQSILRQKLIDKINELPLFKNDPQLKADFLAFLNDPTPLPFKRLNRLAIAFECVSYLTNVDWINQHNTNLCGPSVLMQQVIKNHPRDFVYSVMEMAEQKFKDKNAPHLPARIKEIPKEVFKEDYDLASLWMKTVRHNYNVVLSYTANSKWEFIYGYTTPNQLELMFREFNHHIESETMQIALAPVKRADELLEKAGGALQSKVRHPNLFRSVGTLFHHVRKAVNDYEFLPQKLRMYSDNHQSIEDSEQRLEQLNTWTKQNPTAMISILVNEKLASSMLGLDPADASNNDINTHYVNVQNFSYDGQKVKFDLFTYGANHKIELDAETFKAGYRGALLVLAERPALTMKKES